MADYNVVIDSQGNLSIANLGCRAGDSITWTSHYGQPIDVFNLPSCVSPPHSPAPIAPGTTTRRYTVNNGVHGTYEYSYGFPSVKRDTRSGTIDVG